MNNLSKILRPLLRITLGVAVGLLLVGAALGMALRQPVLGALPFPEGERADPVRLERAVRFLTEEVVPRDVDHPENLERAARFIERELRAGGGRVERQEYEVRGETFVNVLASFGPEAGPRYVVGAHYDAFGGFGPNPGADDNASGTAGVLELARLLGERPPPSLRVDLVAFSTEEPPDFGSARMGSAVFAGSLDSENSPVLGMINLEMIGYFEGRQHWPHWLFGVFYPEEPEFIGIVGRWQDRRLARHVSRAFKGAGGIEAPVFVAPRNRGMDASDHIHFWDRDLPAVMITDTSAIRNPHYHEPTDTAETLDYERMAQVVDGVLAAVLVPGLIESREE